MFGYLTANKSELKVRELERYRSFYCGLCAMLKKRSSRIGQLTLSYDCTFLAILLTALYEPKTGEHMGRCLMHPVVKHKETVSRYTAYAADMSILLTCLKAEDDWMDEKKVSAKAANLAFGTQMKRISRLWPRQTQVIREQISCLHRIERGEIFAVPDEERSLESILEELDMAAGCTGQFFGEICAVRKDMWYRDLYEMGFYLGKFIYLMDALDDMEKDQKKGNYNILLKLKKADADGFDERIDSILIDLAARSCRAFERLPIVTDVGILRNILYSGIWVKKHDRSV